MPRWLFRRLNVVGAQTSQTQRIETPMWSFLKIFYDLRGQTAEKRKAEAKAKGNPKKKAKAKAKAAVAVKVEPATAAGDGDDAEWPDDQEWPCDGHNSEWEQDWCSFTKSTFEMMVC
jgi:hypothetical protein